MATYNTSEDAAMHGCNMNNAVDFHKAAILLITILIQCSNTVVGSNSAAILAVNYKIDQTLFCVEHYEQRTLVR